MKFAMLFCSFIHKYSEFPPRFPGYFGNYYNYFACVFQICIYSAFFLNVWTLWWKIWKEKERQIVASVSLVRCSALVWSWWLSLARKDMHSAWFGICSISKKMKETFVQKDNRTSHSYIWMAKDGQFSAAGLSYCKLSLAQKIEAFLSPK
jgi:hypothetical protein